ncbi:hypothetical protein [Arsenicibacter rosenii]|uniref:Uncharacterized protein n=1 Tax=Arsenicibacter rosenii TaxID=1750698 RepID=A0A1S2VAH9_9BACT|nr:hypothetical protein [Arsenicibacter rosenii]OIN55440.1 hypothetical protein BLX24_30710 [Arsenicibacter rosenii]
MKQRFRIENNEAASTNEAAFLFHDDAPNLMATVIEFRSLLQLDQYETSYPTVQVRSLPILVELRIWPEKITLAQRNYWLKKMAAWYYYTILNPDQ